MVEIILPVTVCGVVLIYATRKIMAIFRKEMLQ